MSEELAQVALRLYAALEAGEHGEQLRELFSADCHTVEHPNLISPAGRQASLEQMLAASQRGAALLRQQRYTDVRVLVAGDTVVLRSTWTGTVAVAAGEFQPGRQLTAHLAQFVTVRDGRIAALETYDCYEQFA